MLLQLKEQGSEKYGYCFSFNIFSLQLLNKAIIWKYHGIRKSPECCKMTAFVLE